MSRNVCFNRYISRKHRLHRKAEAMFENSPLVIISVPSKDVAYVGQAETHDGVTYVMSKGQFLESYLEKDVEIRPIEEGALFRIESSEYQTPGASTLDVATQVFEGLCISFPFRRHDIVPA